MEYGGAVDPPRGHGREHLPVQRLDGGQSHLGDGHDSWTGRWQRWGIAQRRGHSRQVGEWVRIRGGEEQKLSKRQKLDGLIKRFSVGEFYLTSQNPSGLWARGESEGRGLEFVSVGEGCVSWIP